MKKMLTPFLKKLYVCSGGKKRKRKKRAELENSVQNHTFRVRENIDIYWTNLKFYECRFEH